MARQTPVSTGETQVRRSTVLQNAVSELQDEKINVLAYFLMHTLFLTPIAPRSAHNDNTPLPLRHWERRVAFPAH
jgi:hypothetical protein